MKQFILQNIEAIIASIAGTGGFLGWFFERRKRRLHNQGVEADVESKEIENSKEIINMYKTTLDDLGKRYEDKFKDVSTLYEQKIKLLQEEIRAQKRINQNLRRENADLRKRIKELEQ